ncbi:MAG: hypothetical protein HDQ97_09175 [Lachnospiraceae bacterium]|nr:hypothetical protein [Lachnospiraceae bacterium]
MRITERYAGPQETARQITYMEKACVYVEELTRNLGRKPSCCVTTFGCQMNAVHGI